MGLTHIVRRQRSRTCGAIASYRHCRRHPAVEVDIIVVGADIAGAMQHPRVGVVRRHIPCKCRASHRGVEPQELSRVVYPSGAVEPHTLQVQRHIDLLARVGVVAEHPQLIVGRVDALRPHLVHQDVGLNLVFVATVNHDFVLRIQVPHRARGLTLREVAYRRCRCHKTHQGHNRQDCNAFHKAFVLWGSIC